MTDVNANDYILYGMQASLYTGKARAYMRRNRIAVTERGAGHPDYTSKIFPHMNRFIMPVVVTPKGDIIQDGTDILDYLEGQAQEKGWSHEPLYPEGAVLRAVAHLFELFGNEGLLRPAMHYRWNFDDQNLDFLKVSFADVFPAHMDAAGRAVMFDHASDKMRKAGAAFGVNPETYAVIEESYAEFLSLLNAHLKETYYVLGDRPTIADYGLFNPLYAHLARDPAPAHLMKTTAPYVWNWVERMNRPERLQEHTMDNPPTALFAADALPETLTKLMTYVAEEYLAEFSAHVEFAENWLAKNEGKSEDDEKPPARSLGFAAFNWRGLEIKTVVMLYRFYLAQRLWNHYDGSSQKDQASIRGLFAAADLEGFLDTRPSRRVLRKDFHEVWDL